MRKEPERQSGQALAPGKYLALEAARFNKKITCEYCGQSDTVKEVFYGMPGEDTDFDRYVIGGCVPGKCNDPKPVGTQLQSHWYWQAMLPPQ